MPPVTLITAATLRHTISVHAFCNHASPSHMQRQHKEQKEGLNCRLTSIPPSHFFPSHHSPHHLTLLSLRNCSFTNKLNALDGNFLKWPTKSINFIVGVRWAILVARKIRPLLTEQENIKTVHKTCTYKKKWGGGGNADRLPHFKHT